MSCLDNQFRKTMQVQPLVSVLVCRLSLAFTTGLPTLQKAISTGYSPSQYRSERILKHFVITYCPWHTYHICREPQREVTNHRMCVSMHVCVCVCVTLRNAIYAVGGLPCARRLRTVCGIVLMKRLAALDTHRRLPSGPR